MKQFSSILRIEWYDVDGLMIEVSMKEENGKQDFHLFLKIRMTYFISLKSNRNIFNFAFLVYIFIIFHFTTGATFPNISDFFFCFFNLTRHKFSLFVIFVLASKKAKAAAMEDTKK